MPRLCFHGHFETEHAVHGLSNVPGPPARDKAAHQPFSLKEQGEGAPLQQSGVHPVADDGVRGPLPITRQILHDVRPPVIKRTLPCWAGGRGVGEQPVRAGWAVGERPSRLQQPEPDGGVPRARAAAGAAAQPC